MTIAKIKTLFKRLLFFIGAHNILLHKIYYRKFYKPREGSLSELIDNFSRKNKEVVFVQVGANDGFFNDPLYKFIKRDNWRGVLLEPQHYVFNTFLKHLHKGNDNIHTLNAALDRVDQTRTIYKIAFSKSRWATGLTSFKKEVLEESIDSGHVARCAKRYGEPLPEKREDFIAEEKINCISVDTLIDKYKLEPLHWLQIDTEGYDFEIIKMFQIEKTKPTVIVFENSHLSVEDKDACEALLRTNGYRTSFISENTIAINKSYQF